MIRTLGASTILILLLLLSVVPVLSQEADSTPDENAPVPRFQLVAHDGNEQGYFHDVEMLPGETAVFTATAVNSGEIPVELDVFKINANVSINGGYSPGDNLDEPLGLTEWIDFEEASFELQPGEMRELTFSINVPDDAVPGQYISGMMLRMSEPMAIDGTSSINQILAYIMSVGILVPGELHYDMELGEPVVEVWPSETILHVPITNTGNYLVRPSGNLVITDLDGEVVAEIPVQMGSVYAGLSTTLSISLPLQMQPNEYRVSVDIEDADTGASASLENAAVTIDQSSDGTSMALIEYSVQPNAEDIVFADVSVTLDNPGERLAAADVHLVVSLDGEVIENYPLATNQVLIAGDNVISSRFIPSAGSWESGTYEFAIVVTSVDPEGDERIELLNENLDTKIVVP